MALTREIRVIGGSLAFTEPVSANSRPAASFADNNSCASIWAASRRHLRANLYAAGHHHRNVVSARGLCRSGCGGADVRDREQDVVPVGARGASAAFDVGTSARRGEGEGLSGGSSRATAEDDRCRCVSAGGLCGAGGGGSSLRRGSRGISVPGEARAFRRARLVKKPGSRARANVYPEDEVCRVGEEVRRAAEAPFPPPGFVDRYQAAAFFGVQVNVLNLWLKKGRMRYRGESIPGPNGVKCRVFELSKLQQGA